MANELITAYISRAALRHNLQTIRSAAGRSSICAMVKANAYGHGAGIVVRALRGAGVSFWGAATLNEALELRAFNAREPIIVMRPFTPCAPAREIAAEIHLMREMGIRATLVDKSILELIDKRSHARLKPLRVHVKIDTGMGRNGCRAEDFDEILRQIASTRNLVVEGIYSHFASSGADSLDFAREQLAVFNRALMSVRRTYPATPLRHMANSAAIFRLPAARFDMVRPGCSLYGFGPSLPDHIGRRLRPVLRLEAPIVFVKWIAKGETCGYDRLFRARRPTRIGLLPLGYGDGYHRQLSAQGRVSIGNRILPVIGRISMDLTIVDLTDTPGADVGTPVTLISNRHGDPHSIEAIAEVLGTIPHEIACNLGRRVRRLPAD